MYAELLLLLVLVLINGFFALSEMALVRARKTKLKQMAERQRSARAALDLSEHPENFLSAVQIGITLVGVLTGVVSGQTIGSWIAEQLRPIDWIAEFADPVGLGIAVVMITFLSIVLGELIPKRLALVAPERIAAVVGLPMLLFSRLTHPFVVVLAWITRATLRVLGIRQSQDQAVTQEEIRLLVAESHEQGVLEDIERSMINRALRFGDRTAESLMVPRNRIAWLDITAPLAENLAVMRGSPYSRFPVMRGSEQEVIGVLEIKTLVDKIGSSGEFDLFKKLSKPLFVPESTNALTLLGEFREADAPLALVVDEYGDIQGMVTQNDVVAAIMGETVHVGEADDMDAKIVRRADGSYLLDGQLKVEDLKELFGLEELPQEDEQEYQTLAGMLITQLGHIPKVAEVYEWRDLRFEVMDLDGARVDKVLATRKLAPGE